MKDYALKKPLPTRSGDKKIWQDLDGLSQTLALTQNLEQHQGPCVVITQDLLTLHRLEQELKFFLGQEAQILTLADSETLPYDSFSPHPDLISERLQTLQAIPSLHKGIVLVAINTLLHQLPPREFIEQNSLVLKVNQNLDIDNFRKRLERSGYHFVTQVMEHGEYAVRGSIIDIFPMGSEKPYRIDLFDDIIDSIRTFDPDSQLSQKKIKQIKLLPAKEFPLTEDAIINFRKNWREEFSGDPSSVALYQNITAGESAPGIEYYLSLFFPKLNTLFDYLPAKSLVVSFGDIWQEATKFWQEIENRYHSLRHDKTRPTLHPGKIFISTNILKSILKQLPQLEICSGSQNKKTKSDNKEFYSATPPTLNLQKLTQANNLKITKLLDQPNTRILLVTESLGREEYLRNILKKLSLNPDRCQSWQEFIKSDFKIAASIAPLNRGLHLTWPKTDEQLLVLTEHELFSKTALTKSESKLVQTKQHSLENVIRNLTELTIGAPVVHIEHGVGRYLGLQNLALNENQNEFLVLEYAKKTKLYVPVTALHLIGRYTGADAEHSPLDNLGSIRWQKTKQKLKKNIRDVAAQLLGIYAKRAAQTGHKFSTPGEDYEKFTALFPFDETPDQKRAIETVIKDMINPRPMDRIICGDVGFGKTEVAMHAAFVAASQGKQVAMLAPTTILVEQHFRNFTDRFAEFPLKIAMLSRFRSTKELSETLDAIKKGTVDIVIGTHKLLQKDVKFKELGLLVVDEEHRFGVKHKEKIKSLAPNIDILSLTATPIPRTLNMALSGLRDFSVIATPPQGRLSIKTFVRQKIDYLLREAIMREILRGGQIYFLHNDIASIEYVAKKLHKLVPEARIAVGHGQMPKRQLEKIMQDFYKRHINLLVCTTIIESGLDVSTANTIIIDRADRFGLAELHQLRGRVGRSHHQAYAYLLIPDQEALTSNAKKRLEALAQMEDLGVGFSLATRDLEIRGAGELLGEKQSGVMHEVGFDLYMETLERAVHALKHGEEFDIAAEEEKDLVTIELNIPALITDKYVRDVNTRLVLYKRIASAKSISELDKLQIELIDRFGLLPQESKNLFAITELKIRAKELGIKQIKADNKQGTIEFSSAPKVDPGKIIGLVQQQPGVYKLKGSNQLGFRWPTIEKAEDKIGFIAGVLEGIRN